eukprot:TRINITY_DN22250_c0_g2_i1.p1 TRINITY_DN22250_c0_g2~~TRINITY_DN22250_c0_g2_i1.p1  ORF type:complete len:1764 (+),score=593.83 TRINITY_DN22250_c0_g2_i1:78-5369(+)
MVLTRRGLGAAAAWLAAAAVCPAGGERIGDASYPYGGGAVRLAAAVHYGRVEAVLTGAPLCSGLRAVLALTRSDHSITAAVAQHGRGGAAEVIRADGSTDASVQWEPPADPWRADVTIGIEWTSSLVRWLVDSQEVANFTTPAQNASDPYQLPHNVSIGAVASGNSGLATTACDPQTVKVRTLRLYSYDQAARTFALHTTWGFQAQCAATPGTAWAGWSSWERLNSWPAPVPGLNGLLLQSAADCTAQGLELTTAKLTFPLSASGTNLNLQSLSGMSPWTVALDGTAVAASSYDPYCRDTAACSDGGKISWVIEGSGASVSSITTAQTVGPLPLASAATPPEFCLFLWIASTWARGIAAELSPPASYFGQETLWVNASTLHRPYSVCFTATAGSQTYLTAAGDGGARNVPISAWFGAVGGVFFHRHTISLGRAGIWSVGLTTATVAWTDNVAQERLVNPGFDDASAWVQQVRAQNGASAVMAVSGGEYSIAVSAAGTFPDDIRLFQRNVLLQPGKTYRISMRARCTADTRLVRLAVWDQDQVTTHGGVLMVKLTTSFTAPFEHTFVAEKSTQQTGSAAGTAIIALDVGGAVYNAPSNASIFVDYIHLRRWTGTTLDAAVPAAEPAAPAAPPAPPTPIPTTILVPPPPATVNATPAPTPDVNQQWPQKTLGGLLDALYNHRAWSIPFTGVLVEDVDIARLRKEIADILRAQCGLLSECDSLGLQNVDMLSLCYTTLPAPGSSAGWSADARVCRGVGKEIVYFRDATAGNHSSAVVFTFIGLDAVKVSGLAGRTINELNAQLRVGGIAISGLPLTAQAVLVEDPSAATPVPPGGERYGLEDYQWTIIVGLVAVCGLIAGFLLTYQHGTWKRGEHRYRYNIRQFQKEANLLEAEQRGDEDDAHLPMLPLEKLGMLKNRFDNIDTDSGGTIDKKELRDLFADLGQRRVRVHDITNGQFFTYEELRQKVAQKQDRPVTAMEVLEEVEEMWADATKENSRERVEMSKEEFEDFFQTVDKDGNEEVQFDEFSEAFIPYISNDEKKRKKEARRKTISYQAEFINQEQLERVFKAVLQALQDSAKTNTLFDETTVVSAPQQQDAERGCCGLRGGLEDVAAGMVQKAAEKKHGRVGASDPEGRLEEIKRGDTVVVDDHKGHLIGSWRGQELSARMLSLSRPTSAEQVLGRAGLVLQIGAEADSGSFARQPTGAWMDDDEVQDVRDGEGLHDLVLVRFHSTHIHPEADYWMDVRTLKLQKGSTAAEQLSPELRAHTRRMERNMIARAVIAGMISAGLAAVAEMYADKYYGDDSGDGQAGTSGGGSFIKLGGSSWQYWVLVLVPMLVLSVLEIVWLYRDALHTTMRISRHFGLVLYPENEERRFWTSALARACLELGHPVVRPWCGEQWAISPGRDTSKEWRQVQMLMYKAKSGPASFAVKVFMKRLLSRVGAKATQAYFAVPVIMLMNGIVAKLVLNNARVIALAPRLITKMVDCYYETPPKWYLSSQYVVVEHFEKFRVQVLRAIGCVVVARREWHPGLEYLYRTVRAKLGVSNPRSVEPIEGDDESMTGEEWDHLLGPDPEEDLALRIQMRKDCYCYYDMDYLPKLLDALELDMSSEKQGQLAREAEEAREMERMRERGAGEQHYSAQQCSTLMAEYNSESSSEWDYRANAIPLTDEEKKLVLRFLVLAVIVSGRPDHRTKRLVRLCFTRSHLPNPGDKIDDLNYWFEDGNMEQVVNFIGGEQLFLARRVFQGQKVGWTRRLEEAILTLVDW